MKESGAWSHVVELGMREFQSRTLFTNCENCTNHLTPLGHGFPVYEMGKITPISKCCCENQVMKQIYSMWYCMHSNTRQRGVRTTTCCTVFFVVPAVQAAFSSIQMHHPKGLTGYLLNHGEHYVEPVPNRPILSAEQVQNRPGNLVILDRLNSDPKPNFLIENVVITSFAVIRLFVFYIKRLEKPVARRLGWKQAWAEW